MNSFAHFQSTAGISFYLQMKDMRKLTASLASFRSSCCRLAAMDWAMRFLSGRVGRNSYGREGHARAIVKNSQSFMVS